MSRTFHIRASGSLEPRPVSLADIAADTTRTPFVRHMARELILAEQHATPRERAALAKAARPILDRVEADAMRDVLFPRSRP
jgi:hypothetical protein